jgi:hypothetical protein
VVTAAGHVLFNMVMDRAVAGGPPPLSDTSALIMHALTEQVLQLSSPCHIKQWRSPSVPSAPSAG